MAVPAALDARQKLPVAGGENDAEAIGARRFGQHEGVALGQRQIDHDHVVAAIVQAAVDIVATGHQREIITFGLERLSQHGPDAVVILHHQHFAYLGHPHLPASAARNGD